MWRQNGDNVVVGASANVLQTSYIYKGLQPSGYSQTLSSCKTVADGTLPQTPSTTINPKTLQPIPGPQSNPFNVQPPCYVKKDLSFYIFPSAAGIINLYSCYPSGTNILVPTEVEILGSTVADNFVMPFSFIVSLFFANSANTQSSALLSPFYGYGGGSCMAKVGPRNLSAAYTALVNMYGIITVSGFIVPIINLLIMISAMTGLSSMIGGETTIMGLSRFI